MKKILIIGLSIIIAIASSCKKDDVKEKVINAKEVIINKVEASVIEGENILLSANVMPENTTNKTVIWSSTDDNIAKVEEGKVTAITKGEVNIIARSGNVEGVCKVIVLQKEIPVQSITLDINKAELALGKTLTLKSSIVPTNTTDNNLKWSSSDNNIASVNNQGIVTAHKEGIATITIVSSNNKKASCEITALVPVLYVEDMHAFKELYVGYSQRIERRIKPDNATNQTLIWTSSNEECATVNFDGLVSGIKAGTVNIKAVAHNGIELNAEIIITDAPVAKSGFRISPELTVIKKEYFNEIYVNYFSEADKDLNLTWKSSDPSKLDLKKNASGEVKPNYFGGYNLVKGDDIKTGDIVTITATDEEGNISECLVNVTTDVDYKKISNMFTDEKLSVKIGEEGEMPVRFYPTDATDKRVKFFNSDDSILTVSDDGKITPIKLGVTTVTTWSLAKGSFGRTVVRIVE